LSDTVRGRDDRVDPLLGLVEASLHLPGDHDRAAVLGDLVGVGRVVGRADVGDERVVAHRGDLVADDRAERRIGGLELRALDHDDLALRLGLEAGVVEDLVGAVGLADVLVLGGHRLHAHVHVVRAFQR
jgi:hypothetical protein